MSAVKRLEEFMLHDLLVEIARRGLQWGGGLSNKALPTLFISQARALLRAGFGFLGRRCRPYRLIALERSFHVFGRSPDPLT